MSINQEEDNIIDATFEESELLELEALSEKHPVVKKLLEYLGDNTSAIAFWQSKMRKLAYAIGEDIDIFIASRKDESLLPVDATDAGTIFSNKQSDKTFERLLQIIDKGEKMVNALRGYEKPTAGTKSSKSGSGQRPRRL